MSGDLLLVHRGIVDHFYVEFSADLDNNIVEILDSFDVNDAHHVGDPRGLIPRLDISEFKNIDMFPHVFEQAIKALASQGEKKEEDRFYAKRYPG